MFFSAQDRKKDVGLLIMRLGLAAVILWHSLPKLIGGAPAWESIGAPLAFINLGLPTDFWGLLILALETLCGISLIIGYLFRLSSAVLFIMMLLCSFNYFNLAADEERTLMMGFLALTSVFFGFVFAGPGRYALAVKFKRR